MNEAVLKNADGLFSPSIPQNNKALTFLKHTLS